MLNDMREKGQSTPPRDSGMDLLRIVGTAAIVATHAFADFPQSRPLLYTWQVPLFFILSGFFWNPRATFKKELSRRTRSLAVPYASWLAVFLIIMSAKSMVRGNLNPGVFADALRGGMYARTPFTVFWFISALFFARIMLRLCWSATPWLGYALAAMGMALTVLCPRQLASIWLAAGTAVPCVVFLVCGILVRGLESRLAVRRQLMAGAAFAALGVAAYALGSSPMDIKNGDYGTPAVSILASCALCAGVMMVVTGLMRSTHYEWVTMLAGIGLPVVFVHSFILMLLGQVGHASVLAFLVTLAASYAIAWLVHQSKTATRLLG